MPAPTSASRKTVSANFVGEGTAMAAGWGLNPMGRLPVSVTLTEPSALLVNSGDSNEGLVPAAEVVRRFTNMT